MRDGSKARRDLVLAATVALLAAATVFVAPGSSVPPFLPIGDYAAYDASTAPMLVLVEPVAHAPWLGAPVWPVAVAVATAVLGSLALASSVLGVPTGVTTVILVALVSRPDLRVLLAMAAPAPLAVAGIWGALLALRLPPPLWRAVIWSAALTTTAVALWPPVVLVVPVVAAVWWAARGGAGAGIVLLAAGAGSALGLWRWASEASAIGAATLAIDQVWSALATAGDRGTDPFVWPPLSSVRLPLLLMALGAVKTLATASRRWKWLGGGVATLVLAALVPVAWRAEALRALYWIALPLAAVGLHAVVTLAAPRRRPVVLGMLALVLIGSGISASVREVETEEPRAFAAGLGQRLAELSRQDAPTFVAEDTRVDTALVATAGRRLSRVRPSPQVVAERLAAGTTVLAGTSGRRALELWGLRFAERVVVAAPVRLPFAAATGRFRCVPLATPWRDLPGLEFTGRLGVQLPPGRGRFEAVVVSTPPAAPVLISITGQPRGRLTPLPLVLDKLPGVLWPRGALPLDGALRATQVEMAAAPGFAQSLALALGERAPLVAARYVDDASDAGVATVCAAPLPREDPLAARTEAAIALDDPAFFFGGWHQAEGAGPAAFRWTSGRTIMLVPSSAAREVTVAVDARPAVVDTTTPSTITATINGWTAGTRLLAGASTYEWTVPASIWIDGTNQIVLDVSRVSRPSDTGGHDTRELGAAVTGIRLRRGLGASPSP